MNLDVKCFGRTVATKRRATQLTYLEFAIV